jgi:hypothetical protein
MLIPEWEEMQLFQLQAELDPEDNPRLADEWLTVEEAEELRARNQPRRRVSQEANLRENREDAPCLPTATMATPPAVPREPPPDSGSILSLQGSNQLL